MVSYIGELLCCLCLATSTAVVVEAFETLELPEEELRSGADFTEEEKKEIRKDTDDAFERMEKRNEESDRFFNRISQCNNTNY